MPFCPGPLPAPPEGLTPKGRAIWARIVARVDDGGPPPTDEERERMRDVGRSVPTVPTLDMRAMLVGMLRTWAEEGYLPSDLERLWRDALRKYLETKDDETIWARAEAFAERASDEGPDDTRPVPWSVHDAWLGDVRTMPSGYCRVCRMPLNPLGACPTCRGRDTEIVFAQHATPPEAPESPPEPPGPSPYAPLASGAKAPERSASAGSDPESDDAPDPPAPKASADPAINESAAPEDPAPAVVTPPPAVTNPPPGGFTPPDAPADPAPRGPAKAAPRARPLPHSEPPARADDPEPDDAPEPAQAPAPTFTAPDAPLPARADAAVPAQGKPTIWNIDLRKLRMMHPVNAAAYLTGLGFQTQHDPESRAIIVRGVRYESPLECARFIKRKRDEQKAHIKASLEAGTVEASGIREHMTGIIALD